MSKARKEALFKHFSANLSLIHPQYSGVFACPLCLRLFGNIDELDEAHIFPKSLGGRKITLTCRACNNWVGSEIESHEARRASYLTSDKDRARLAVEGVRGNIGVDFWVPHDNEGNLILNQQILDNVSDPKVATQIEQMFETRQIVGRQNQLTIPLNFNPEKAHLVYLHSGFLYLFHNFGYAWAFNPVSEKVRSQLANPNQTVYEPIIWELPEVTANIEERTNDIILFVVFRPYEMIGFLIATPKLIHESGKRLYIWFPVTPEGLAPPKQHGAISITEIKINGDETHSQLDKPGAESIVRNTLLSVLR